MAAGPLSLHPALRGWYAAGLRHIYLDDEALAHWGSASEEGAVAEKAVGTTRCGAPEGASYAHRTPQTMPRPQGAPSQNVSSYRQARQAEAKQEADRAQQEADRARQASEYARQSMQEPLSRLDGQPSRFAQGIAQGPQPSDLPVEQWPKAWQERLNSTVATSKGVPVLWTYWALGEDLSGAPNAPRRDILRQIIGALHSPRGTHCFWPIALPSEDTLASQATENTAEGVVSQPMELLANAPLFLAGLTILAPRVCVVMGSKALRTILPHSTVGPFQQTEYGRLLFLVLPDMDMLLAERERIPRVVAYLRSALSPFIGRMT